MSRLILVMTPHDRWPSWTGAPPAGEQDLELPYRLLRQRGYDVRRMDTFGLPWNPAARAHPLLHALDPLRALRVLLLLRRCEVVLCNFESSALVVLMLRRLLRFRGKVVVMDVGGLGWRLRRLVLDRVVPRADALLVYTEHQAAIIRQTWPGVRRVKTVRPQTDTLFFTAAPDCPSGPVLSVGDDGSRDYPTLLAALDGLGHPSLIRTKMPLGPLPDGVSVLAEPMPLTAYRSLLAGAAIVVLPLHPTQTPGGVSVLMQAMATGKACVISASPGLTPYVQDGVDGLVVPVHDQAALRAAVQRLLSDTGLRQRLGAAARQTAEREFSYAAWADELETVIDEVTGQEQR